MIGAYLSTSYHRAACDIGFYKGWPLCQSSVLPTLEQFGIILNYGHRVSAIFVGILLLYVLKESETFRKLLVKNYQLFVLDEQYRKDVSIILDDVANGTVDADDAIATISNLTSSYDGKAKVLINENATFNNLITLEMVSWVRDNFIIESKGDLHIKSK